MARDHYHENSFLFKTITLARIVVGVALTLAVLFVMVWLIDYSSTTSEPPHRRQKLLLPESGDEPPRTLFESLLNRQSAKNTEPAGSRDSVLDRVPLSDSPSAPKPPATALPQPVKPQSPASVPSAPAPAASAPQVPTPVPAQPVAHQRFAVQLGSFHEAERARTLSARLSGQGYQAYVDTRVLPDGTTAHRVRVGGFATREEAMHMASRIERAEKISGFVTVQ